MEGLPVEPVEEAVPVPLDDQIACLAREIAMRRNVYPRWVKQGKLSQANADKEMLRIQAALETIKGVQAGQDAHSPELHEVRMACYARAVELVSPHLPAGKVVSIMRELGLT